LALIRAEKSETAGKERLRDCHLSSGDIRYLYRLKSDLRKVL
jgi:hypothetical protein